MTRGLRKIVLILLRLFRAFGNGYTMELRPGNAGSGAQGGRPGAIAAVTQIYLLPRQRFRCTRLLMAGRMKLGRSSLPPLFPNVLERQY